ncbi:peptidase S45 family protein [Sphingomonas changbaiensis NBRC 104936]|uniref:Peptidase S45 family protein n=1 Tax=Sphingomonas changbaiensis NBRC 104936 TaxID=1219043 RepID=A0A0E9MPG5_9SPHN|nr:penicillin acylase family protein [Sphingomonas changbaiensis]GAO39667.1 peptidase S45 family protein [Sphingomonas changbaiensis NBRC 104936]
MKSWWKWTLGGVVVVAAVAAADVIAFSPLRARLETVPEPAGCYEVLIRRDRWGVPHVKGRTDAAAAFGLGWAQSEDDFVTLEQVLAGTRGRLGELTGAKGAAQDYAYHLLGVRADVDRGYETKLSPQVRKVVEAYADGVNLYAARHPGERHLPGLFPITGKDIVAGFALTSPFFFGLDHTLGALVQNEPLPNDSNLGTDKGSNAFAVAPSRSADGATRLLLNSHQPWTGPVAWYEAHVTSDEGLDMAGGLFPIAPFPLTGHNRTLGWANTVNRPDLIDVYRLTLTDGGRSYRFDGGTRPLGRQGVWLWVRFGPFVLPVRKTVYRAIQGPVIVNKAGAFAIRYGSIGEIRQVEQYYRLTKARNYGEWIAAMRMAAVPATNFVYADATGRIGLFYNARFPERAPGFDWRGILPGDTNRDVWRRQLPFDAAPQLVSPASGFVVNANNSPWLATQDGSNLKREAYSPLLGIEENVTNRALRGISLLSALPRVSADDLWHVKMDTGYDPRSNERHYVDAALQLDLRGSPDLARAQALLRTWDGTLDGRGSADALAFLVVKFGMRAIYSNRTPPPPRATLAEAVKHLTAAFGRLDPPLTSLVRLRRGTLDLPLTGGPGALRAIYTDWADDGRLFGNLGDSYIMLVTWDKAGTVHAQSIHQFGAATSHPDSRHYADQAPLFARGQLKPAWFSEDELAPNIVCAYRPGQPHRC